MNKIPNIVVATSNGRPIIKSEVQNGERKIQFIEIKKEDREISPLVLWLKYTQSLCSEHD